MQESHAADSLESKLERAVGNIRQFKGAVVALSAGVDSSLVAVLAQKALGEKAVAATAVSESLPPGELEVAEKTAREIHIQHVIMRTDELQNPNYYTNPADRCYYCKDTLFRELKGLADELGFEAVLDGTQVDDQSDDRPGRRAAREWGVKSPLLDAGFTKKEVREAARMLGVSIWDKPAMPCLSSRIPHGQQVTEEKLLAIGQAELFIKQLTGARDLRVRHHGDSARIEVRPAEQHLFIQDGTMGKIRDGLETFGFKKVTLEVKAGREASAAGSEGLLLPIVNAA